MKAYQIDRFDGIDGWSLRERETPQPGANEVLLRMRASALNYRDLMILRGRYPLPANAGVVALSDGAGEVAAVGSGVTRLAVGDRVACSYYPRWLDGRLTTELAMEQFGCTRDGMLAEYVLADEPAVVKIPPHLSFEEGATLPCAAVTAWSSLTGPRPVLPGETLLTIGTGGVALFALQFAQLFGVRVIALTSSGPKADLLRSLGADEVVNYQEQPDWHRAVRQFTRGRGVDHVVETGGVRTLAKSLACCASDGHVALVATLGAGGSIDARQLASMELVNRVFVGSRASFEAMNRAIQVHALRPVVDRVFAFKNAVDALLHFEARHHVGKVVIAGA
jgi:NADPH:quinone reductase-like Zn-dependent oxidoreductase